MAKNGECLKVLVLSAAIISASGILLTADDAGKKTFDAKCASCHGKDGKGNPAMVKMFKVEPAVMDLTSGKLKDEDLQKVILDGRNKMPAFSKQLSADELKAVTQYAKSLAGAKGAGTKKEDASAGAGSSDAAKKDYEKSCASCHGKDGKGNPAMVKMLKVDAAALDLVDAASLGKSDADLAKAVNDGVNKMPAYKGKIADGAIPQIVAYIRSLKK